MSATLDPRRREAARLAELNRLGAMQPEADRVLQELVDDAREVLGTEFCMVNLVTADAQFFKVWSGEMPPEIAAARQTPRERSMCRHVVEDERQFVVEDFLTTERFREQHLRMGPGIRFYAGTPLKTSEGHAIGSLCLVDSRPREFDGKDEATLRAFARAVVGRLEALGAAVHEREAKESERQYRQNVFELANDAILIYGTETGLILDANRRACEMYGFPQERLVGKKVAELSLEPGDEEGYVRELLHRGAHRGFETVHRRADGAPMDVSVNSSVIEYGGQRAVLSINRDVTRRRRAEEVIRRSHARNNAILQASPDLTFLFNRDGEFLDLEATAKEEQLYVPAEAIIGRRLGDMMPAEIAETALRFIAQALDTGELQVYEYRLSMQDGPRDFEARLVKSGANEVLSIVRDVTERRRTEEALRLSERSFAQAQRIARIGNWEHELGENRTHWSDEMYRNFGLAPRDLVPSYRTFMLFVHPDDKRRVGESVRAALYGSGPEDIEYRIVRPDGEVRSVYTQYEAVYDATGRPLKFFGTVQDVTEHKEAEQKLKEAERKYRLLVEQIPAVAYIDRADVPDAASYTSPRIETLLGYTPEEWLNGRLWLERLHPEDRDWVLETDTRARAAEEPFCEEYRLIAKDGRTVWVRDESELLRDEAGRPLLWQGILIDITERKRVEEELRQSEARFRTIFERSAMGISIADRDRRLLETNPAYQSMLGYSGQELLGKPIAEISHPEDVPEDDDLNAALVAGDLGSYRREKRYVRKDGEVIWVRPNISVVRDADGEPQFLVGMVEDITERKKREERLREAEEKYRTLVEQTPAVTYIEALDEEEPGQDTLYISPQVEDLLGYSPDEWISEAGLFERLLHPEDRERVLAEDARTERTGEPFRMEYRLIARDGRTVWVRDDAVQVKSEEGRPLYWQGVVYDVTERKEAEAALRESEERLQKLTAAAFEGIIIHDGGEILAANKAYAAMHGCEIGEIIGRSALEWAAPEYRDLVRQHILSGYEEPYESVEVKKDGTRIDVEVRGRAVTYRGRAVRVAAVRDVTERKRAEEALRRSEERFRSLIQNAPDVITVLDADGNILYDSPSIRRVLGYEPTERIGSNGLAYVHPEDLERAKQTFVEALGNPGGEVRVEYRLRHKDGSWRHFEATRTNLLDEPAVEGMVINCRDVTERRRAEGALRRSEERHRLVVRATNEVIWDNDLVTGSQIWDGAVSAMFGYPPEELGDEGRWWQERIHPDDRPRVLSGLTALLEGEGEVWTEEYRFRRKDGSYATVVDRGYVVRDEVGSPVRMLGSMMDITERKRTEEALRESERRHRRQASELGLLHQVRTALAQDLDPPAVFRAVVDTIARTYGYTLVSAYRLQGASLVLQHQVGYERVLDRIPVDTGIMGRVARTGEPVLLGDVRSDPEFLGAIEGITSEVCVPLLDEGEVVGTLNVGTTSDVELTEADLRLMAALAEHVSVALGRARLLARVRESEERFRALIQNSSDVITLLEVDGTVRYQSPSIEQMLGYRPEELVGKNAFDYIHPDDLERAMDAFSKMLAEPESRPSACYRFRHKDGSWRHMESIGSNLLDDPRVGELVVNSRDVTERRLWEEKLREAEERYRSLIETIPAITYVAELDGISTPLYLSPQYEAILGFTAEERLSTPDLWVRRLHPEDRERVVAANDLSNATGDPFDEEYRLIAKDGREVWLHDASVVLRGAEGRPSYRQGVMYDVTERRRTEEALHASELRLRTVIEQSPLGIHIFAPDGTSLLTNGAWDVLWYLNAEEAGREGNVFEDEQLREAGLIRYIERSAAEGAPIVAPLLLFDPAKTGREGRPRWLRTLIYPVKGEDGRVLETVLLLEDFTERKWAEDALGESEERYRAVVEQSAEAIWIFDPETKRVLEANAAFQAMLGYDAEELRAMTNYDFVAHSREDVDRTVERKLRGEENPRSERKYRMKNGTLIDVEVGGTVISYRGKQVVCSVARDITERKRVEEEIRETNRRLGELATLRADFAAMVAHELDTPLAVIRGYADVLATGELGPEKSERALSQIQAETEVLNALVEDVRVAASAERKDFIVNPREVPVDELLDAAARFVVTLPGDHPLDVGYATEDARWDGVRAGFADPFIFEGGKGREVWADRYRIGQVLRNLLANAIKYSPEGAPISLRAMPGEAPGRLRIEVADRGPGIHPDDAERIFEKFGRGRTPEGKKVSGLGLGLYLSRRILRAHGSDLTVSARPEGGSVFGFELEEVER